jgi:hypothetical protein
MKVESMNNQTGKSEDIKRLQTLKNIGPKMAEKLYILGIRTPEQIRKSNPDKLFERLKAIDAKVDPCELYAFRGAIGNFSISSGIGFQMCCVNDDILVKVHWHAEE